MTKEKRNQSLNR